MDNRREPFVVTALVAGLLGLGSPNLAAKRDTRPTMSVVAFSGSGGTTESGDAMADDLATRLVETGRYRVLPRQWLMASVSVPHPTPDTLRAAAAAAGVDYLVLGETRLVMARGRARLDVTFIDVRVVSVATGEVISTAAGRIESVRRSPIPVVPMVRPGSPRSIVPALALAAVSARARSGGAQGVVKQRDAELARIAQSITLPEVP